MLWAGGQVARPRYPPAALLGDTGRVVRAGLLLLHVRQLPPQPGGVAGDQDAVWPAQPGQLLGELTGFHLLTERAAGRYASHDLLRSYAAELSVATDSPADRQASVRRMLDHYLHTAHAAELLISPSRQPIALVRPLPRVTPEPLSGAQAAMAWFSAEREVLQAAVTLAMELGFDSYGWQIPWALAKFLDQLGHWEEGAASQQIALAAAERLGDDAAQAHARLSLGRALGRLGRGQEATRS